MDILTLGKMNQMAKDLDQTMEYLANTTFETLKDVCDVQADINATQTGQVTCLQDETQTGLDALIAAGGGGTLPNEFMIWNCDHWSANNGGCCMSWTVPTDTKLIQFEIVGGGGPGSGVDDHTVAIGGDGGSYASKIVCADAGDFEAGTTAYTLCAAGTSCCSECRYMECTCCHGCTSYVTGAGLSNFCANGGYGGDRNCNVNSNCYNCYRSNASCNIGRYTAGWMGCHCTPAWSGADYGMCGTSGGLYRGYSCCHGHASPGASAGPWGAGGGEISGSTCSPSRGCCHGHNHWPGGGGHAGTAGGGCCWGGFGAGGLVKVTYYK